MKSLRLFLLFLFYNFLNVRSYCIYNETPSTEVWYSYYENKETAFQIIHKRIILSKDKSCCMWNEKECHRFAASTEWWSGKPKERSTDVTVTVACSRWQDNLVYTKVRMEAGGYLDIYKSPTPGQDNYIDVYNADKTKRCWYRCGTDNYRVEY